MYNVNSILQLHQEERKDDRSKTNTTNVEFSARGQVRFSWDNLMLDLLPAPSNSN